MLPLSDNTLPLQKKKWLSLEECYLFKRYALLFKDFSAPWMNDVLRQGKHAWYCMFLRSTTCLKGIWISLEGMPHLFEECLVCSKSILQYVRLPSTNGMLSDLSTCSSFLKQVKHYDNLEMMHALFRKRMQVRFMGVPPIEMTWNDMFLFSSPRIAASFEWKCLLKKPALVNYIYIYIDLIL